MNEQQLDIQGEAHEALGTAVNDYGRQILNDPRMLGNLVTDLLPDLPRERSLLVTAAESNVAGELTRHVQEQRLDADTAVQLVARSLTDRRSIDLVASTWVTTEYAQALGYRTSPAGRPASVPTEVAAPQPVMTAVAPNAYPQTPPPYQAAAPQQPYPPVGPAGGYPTGIPPQAPPSWPSQPPARKRRNLVPILAAGGAAVIVGIYFAVAAVAGIAPFAKHPPKPPSHPIAAPTHTQRTTPAPSPAPTSSVLPLADLLPADVDDPATQCQTAPAADWNNPGLVQALKCTDPGLPGGNVYAYQLNSSANYQAAWANFNSFWQFDASTAGSSCPPASSGGEGTTAWNSVNNFYPARPGQVVECQQVGTTSSNEPSYAWTFPTQDAFIIAQAAPGSTFSALQTWWSNNATPLTSPSATPSS
jgi:hypothetical protein